MPKTPAPRAFVAYRGPSMLDGAPIVCLVTLDSRNRKTGDMAQTWILREDVAPHVAARDGRDASVCGTCPHRRNAVTGIRTCYVTVHNAPLSTWRAHKASPRPALPDGWTHETVRIGSYGDPGALPLDVVQRLAMSARVGWTGYTHAWRSRPDLRPYLMASVDSVEEEREAQAAGWRTFRVREVGARLFTRTTVGTRGPVECLSETHAKTCAECLLCSGGRLQGARSVVIDAHGASARRVGRGLPVLQA